MNLISSVTTTRSKDVLEIFLTGRISAMNMPALRAAFDRELKRDGSDPLRAVIFDLSRVTGFSPDIDGALEMSATLRAWPGVALAAVITNGPLRVFTKHMLTLLGSRLIVSHTRDGAIATLRREVGGVAVASETSRRET